MSITDYLPHRAKNDTMIQGRVPYELAREVKKIMVRENLSMSDMLTACFRYFLAEKTAQKLRDTEGKPGLNAR